MQSKTGGRKMKLWYVPFKSAELEPSSQVYGADGNRILAAQAFTIELRTVMVGPDLDRWPRGDNDVLISTTSKLGIEPKVDRVHSYREELPAQTTLESFFGRTIYLCDDYDGKSTLWMELKVLEVDQDLGDREELVNAFTQMAYTVGAVFPAALPYTAAANILAKASHNLIKVFEENKAVIECPITFYGPGRVGTPLQIGKYVAFSDEVDGADFELAPDFKLNRKAGAQWTGDLSYAVFTIERVQDFPAEYIVSQRVAKLLTQLDRGNPKVIKSGFEFATETLRGYSVYKDIDRLKKLDKKSNRTPEETARLEQLREKLAQYLPS
jgi:hypothetical protein